MNPASKFSEHFYYNLEKRCVMCPSHCSAFKRHLKPLALTRWQRFHFLLDKLGFFFFKAIHIYSRVQGLRRIGNEACFWTGTRLKAKSYGRSPSEGTESKECSWICEGEEASGREQRAKGNKSNIAFVVPENKTQDLEKQTRAGCKPPGFLTRASGGTPTLRTVLTSNAWPTARSTRRYAQLYQTSGLYAVWPFRHLGKFVCSLFVHSIFNSMTVG